MEDKEMDEQNRREEMIPQEQEPQETQEQETQQQESQEQEPQKQEPQKQDVSEEPEQIPEEPEQIPEEPEQRPEQKPEKMSEKQAEAVIEAILFAMGDTVEISKLAEVVELDTRTVKKILRRMEERYTGDNRGIMLARFDDAVQLCTKPELYEYLIRIAKTPKKLSLTETVIETLSIIAYKQPVTRLDVEAVRGVNCDHAINKLLEYGLIMELGRLDAPGRPILFGTTEQFLRCFGVSSLEDLPEMSTLQLEEFKAQAEAEVQLKLDI